MNFKNTSLGRSLITITQIFGSKIYKNNIIRAENIPFSTIDNYHLLKCKKEINNAIKNVPYYEKPSYKKALKTNNLDSFLEQIPVIDKNTFLSNTNSFFSANWSKGRTKHTTSGSSGSPLTIYSSIREKLYAQSMLLCQIQKITGEWGMKDTLYLSGFYVNSNLDEENFFTRDKLFNNTYVSIYHFRKENAEKYLSLLQRYKPKIIYGYASAINELASILEPYGEISHNIKIIISTSEILTESYRSNIEKVFNLKVTDMYGSQEGGHFAFECQYGVKHIHPARGIIQVKNVDTISRTGKGEAIITAINRPSFPLFKYNLKDIVEIEEPMGRCACGLETYIIKDIEGRSEDMVITSDGRRIGYLNFHATKDLTGLKESQLIQTGYEQFIFKCIFEDYVTMIQKERAYEHIKLKLEERIGLKTSINFEDVNLIEKSSKGKFKAVIVQNFLDDEVQ